MGNFKIGDNIEHNLDILGLLYKYYENETPKNRNLLRKPILITIVSIIDAVLYDFFDRIITFTSEGVRGLDRAIVDDIRSKKNLDDLSKFIAVAKKHNLFGNVEKVYEKLDELRKLRNRIHIQNDKNHFENNESDVFTEGRMKVAEIITELVVKFFSKTYSRDKSKHYNNDFAFPWNEHLDDTGSESRI